MNSNILTSQIMGTPPITRFIAISILGIMLLVYINAVQPYALLYSPLFIKYMELWRIFTCFLYFGKPSLDVIIHITFLYRYSRMLEEGFIYTSDYFYLILVIWAILFGVANLFNISTLASAFSSTITYIWTRRNPNAMVQIFGFITFPAFYLPFIVPVFMLITEKRILIEDLLGIVVGHFYFFFKDVYPKFGRDVLRTPCFIKKIFREHTEECCKKEGRPLNLNNSVNTPLLVNHSTRIEEDSSAINESLIERSKGILANDCNIGDQSINKYLDEKIKEESKINESKVGESKINESKVSESKINESKVGESKVSEVNRNKESNINENSKINDNSKINESKVDEDLEELNGWSSQTISSDSEE